MTELRKTNSPKLGYVVQKFDETTTLSAIRLTLSIHCKRTVSYMTTDGLTSSHAKFLYKPFESYQVKDHNKTFS